MTIKILLDACVLVPMHLRNLLLSLAEADFFVPLWSDSILQETERALRDDIPGMTAEKATEQVQRMRAAFPQAEVTGYEGLIKAMTNHRKDRHVLAAAVKGGADLLVTANVRDFPDSASQPYDIEILNPDGFLASQLDLNPRKFVQVLDAVAGRYRKPQLDSVQVLQAMRGYIPDFAQLLGSSLILHEPISTADAWSVQLDDDEIESPFKKDDHVDQTDPREVGMAWWMAICQLPKYRTALENLSIGRSTWRNQEWLVEDAALATGIDYAIEAPERLAYMRFCRDSGSSEKIFVGGYREMAAIMVIIRVVPGDDWRVHSITNNYTPAVRIFGSDR